MVPGTGCLEDRAHQRAWITGDGMVGQPVYDAGALSDC